MSGNIFSKIAIGYHGTTAPVESNVNKTSEKKKKSAEIIKRAEKLAPIIIPMAAIPLTALITYKISTKNVKELQKQVIELGQKVTQTAQDVSVIKEAGEKIKTQLASAQKADGKIWGALLAAFGIAGGVYSLDKLTDDDKDKITKQAAASMGDIKSQASQALNRSQQAPTNSNSLARKYTKNYNGISLLTNNDGINKNAGKYTKAIKAIRETAGKYLYSENVIPEINKEHPVLWSVTSEFAPVKEGGLGSVPVEIQNNMTKLGIQVPTFIPMYQSAGIASFKEENGKYLYTYKNKTFDLEKAAEFTVDAYRGGKISPEKVEVFVHNSKDKDGNNKQLVFIKNDTYFNGTIYQSMTQTEEPEKFAFFSKVVYELAKLKEDINGVKGLKLPDDGSVLASIPTMDGLILNDWQASPIAALARYKAPMENAYGQISDKTAQKLQNIGIITIGHNAMYQGSTRNNNDDVQRSEATSNILNTLFDSYAYDISVNARTLASETNPADKGLKNLDNAVIINHDDYSSNHTNLLNIGVVLSNYFCPVSQNYANELISPEHADLSGELQWALTQKAKAGAMVGIINGNDFNNLSIEATAGNIKRLTGLDYTQYNKSSNIADILSARELNKSKFYNDFIIPLSMKNDADNKTPEVEKIRDLTQRLEFVESAGKTTPPALTDEELKDTPIISSGGRLVSQKGIGIMTGAIKMLFDNWDKDFPNKNKPIFYIAGQDGENGSQRKYIEDLKSKELNQNDSNRVIFAHGFAPMAAMMAASDYFLMPSIFEPCGLTQGEALALATPVIASSVGGIVDTVNRNGKVNGILTDITKPLSVETLYDAMKKALKIYFDDKDEYQSMVKNALDEDFSWAQPGNKGPCFEYLNLAGIKKA